jgi:hypothetical protein
MIPIPGYTELGVYQYLEAAEFYGSKKMKFKYVIVEHGGVQVPCMFLETILTSRITCFVEDFNQVASF